MAGCTILSDVCTGQRELAGGMVKGDFRPYIAGMAKLALRRVQLRFVLLCIVILYLVTGYALWQRVYNTSFMTVGALLYPGMTANEFEPGCAVVEC